MSVKIIVGEAREALSSLPEKSVQCCITSPPYWGLRSYTGDPGMIGLEPTWNEHLENMIDVFRGVSRVLRNDGILVVNYGDAYAAGGRGPGSGKQTTNTGSDLPPFKAEGWAPKNLMMMPARLAIAMQDDGWILRSQIPWIKKNPMPESVADRPTNATEYFFLFAKNPKYFWDAVAVRTESLGPKKQTGFRNGAAYRDQSGPQDNSKLSDKQRGHDRRHDGLTDKWDAMPKEEQQANGANMRNYLFEATVPFKGPHFATFPPKVIEPFILAGTSEKGCCPECGAPWVRVAQVSYRNDTTKTGRPAVGNDAQSAPGDTKAFAVRTRKHVKTLRWEPSCECDAGEPVPCTILDCFGGAGTTGLVADRHKRDAVLVEISPDYAEIARKRIVDDIGMLADVHVEETGEKECQAQP